jgi:hypothetical protein
MNALIKQQWEKGLARLFSPRNKNGKIRRSRKPPLTLAQLRRRYRKTHPPLYPAYLKRKKEEEEKKRKEEEGKKRLCQAIVLLANLVCVPSFD